jgi:hypothetical protein
MQYLRQSTAVDVMLGVFIDDTTGKDTEEALTLAQADLQLSKNCGAAAQKTEATSATHIYGGNYKVPLDATDTGTLGRLDLMCKEAGALPVKANFMVITANAYDSMCSTDKLEVDIAQIGGVTQSLTDFKDFVDTGYDPATHKVQSDLIYIHGSALTETAGQLAAAFVKLFDVATPLLMASDVMVGTDGANTTVPDAAGVAATPAEVATALTNINLDHLCKTATAGADMTAEVVDNTILSRILSNGDTSVFVPSTDGLQLIRDRGDSAWTTGAGGSDRLLMVDTTIATLASQTSFTLTAGSADDNAYNNCTIIIEDVSTAAQKAVGIISDYTGATKTITLKYDPAIFTMATTDKVYILAENALKSTLANRQLNVAADGDIAGNIDGSVASVVGHTAQTGDSYAVVNHADHGNAKLVRSTTPANKLDISATGEAGLDFNNIKDATGAKTLTNITVPTCSTNTDMRGTDGANTTVPDVAGTAATLHATTDGKIDTNKTELDGLQGTDGKALVSTDAQDLSGTLDVNAKTATATALDLILEDSTFALAIKDAVWNAILTGVTFNIASSAGRRVREIGAFAIHSGTAQAGSGYSITLDVGASASDGIYNRNLIVLTDNTGSGQTRTIVDYNGTTKVCVIDRDWRVSPDATTEYQVVPDDTPLTVDHGVAQGGTSTTITIRDYASSVDDAYLCNIVTIIAGKGRGQARLVGAYNGTTKVVTICGDNWVETPDATSIYVMMPYGTTCTSCIGTSALGQINAEVVDVIKTDTKGEPAQGAPGATLSIEDKIAYTYKFLRNQVWTTETEINVYNNAADTVDHKSTISDDGTTFKRGEFESGP